MSGTTVDNYNYGTLQQRKVSLNYAKKCKMSLRVSSVHVALFSSKNRKTFIKQPERTYRKFLQMVIETSAPCSTVAK